MLLNSVFESLKVKMQTILGPGQTSHHSCAYFKINRFDELSSTKIRCLPQALGEYVHTTRHAMTCENMIFRKTGGGGHSILFLDILKMTILKSLQ